MKGFILLIIVAVLLLGCDSSVPLIPPTPAPAPYISMQQLTGGLRSYGVYRLVDEEFGVVCWVTNGVKAAGIDCIALSELE